MFQKSLKDKNAYKFKKQNKSANNPGDIQKHTKYWFHWILCLNKVVPRNVPSCRLLKGVNTKCARPTGNQ